MTALGRLMALFPATLLALTVACLTWFAHAPGPLPGAALLGVLYLLPPLTFRLHAACFPLREGQTPLVGRAYSPWWGGHQIQVLYIALPQLEALLRLLPGVYSAWLRLWGSRIGRRVYWTPCIDVSDRSLLHIGDGVILGHRCGLFAHMITPVPGNLLLYVRHIHLEPHAFIGAGANLAPGVRVKQGALVRATTQVYPNTEVAA